MNENVSGVCEQLSTQRRQIYLHLCCAIGGTDLDDDLQKAIRMSMLDAQENGTMGQ